MPEITIPHRPASNAGSRPSKCVAKMRARAPSFAPSAIDRSTLSNWVGRTCWWLTPLYELLLSTALSSDKLFADDTTLPVLDPGRGKTKTGRLWCYAVDDRPWTGPSHPIAVYVYSEDRKNIRPAEHLAGFRGVPQVDGYDGFKRLAGNRADHPVCLAFC